MFHPQPKPETRVTADMRTKRQAANAHRDVYTAVTMRDGGCRCCGRAWGLHRHHLVFRSQGGATTTANVLLLCDSCHHAVHKHRLTICGNDANGSLIFQRAGTGTEAQP